MLGKYVNIFRGGKEMEVIKVIPQGFCKGVVRAIMIAEKTAQEYPNSPIYVLGMIVHNKYVVASLEKLGIRTLEARGKTRMELLESISEGVVIITAHGVNPEVIELATKKGLIVVDATCQDVKKTQQLLISKLQQGYDIIYFGVKGHPEAEAMCSLDNNHIHLVFDEKSLNELVIDNPKVLVTNQTTMSVLEIRNWIETIQTRFPTAQVQPEICSATSERQQAVLNLNNIDALFVVGDPSSNNTLKLASIAQQKNAFDVYLAESADDISDLELSNLKKVAVTSGASTPSYLTDKVIECLQGVKQSG